jgi:hypothetical protein
MSDMVERLRDWEQGGVAGTAGAGAVSDRRMGQLFDLGAYVPLPRSAPVEYEPSYHADPLGRFPAATFDERFRGM